MNWINLIPGLFGIGEKVVDGISKNAEMKHQITQAGIDLQKLKEQINLEVVKLMIQDGEGFRNFTLNYEGKAKDLPKGLLWLRSSFRPIASFFFLIIIMIHFVMKFFFGKDIPLDNQFWNLAMIVFGFFFAERTGSRVIQQIRS